MQPKLTCRSIREENQRNIIRSLLQHGEMLRNDLARENSISIMTVKNVVDELIASGVLEENVLATAVGRKPKMLRLSAQFGTIACVSLTSKDYFVYQIFDLYGKPVEERNIVFDAQLSYLHNLELLCAHLKSDLDKLPGGCVGLGVTVPSAYYEESDLVNHDLIPDFENLHLGNFFQTTMGIENVVIVHDVFCAAQAEYDADQFQSMFYFFAGYGVGGAFIEDGRWHTGADLVAGEVGQCLISTPQGDQQLERLVSLPTLMSQIHKELPEITPYQAFQRYDAGDAAVCAIMDHAAEIIAKALANIVWILNPEVILIGSNFQKYAAIIVKACQRQGERIHSQGIRARMRVEPVKLQNGELQGIFNITKEHWVYDLILRLPRG